MPARKMLQAQNLTDRVAAVLGEEITGGRYSIGDILQSETDMAKSFGVSRTVMREAVSRLKADGLVASKQGAGLFVTATQRQIRFHIDPTDHADIEKLLPIVELRQGFEVEAAGLAALRATAEDLAAMREALDRMADALEKHDTRAGVEADIDFHLSICRATHNPYYAQLFETFRTVLLENISVSREKSHARSPDDGPAISPAQGEHDALFAAIESGDDHAARLRARKHLENTRKRLIDSANARGTNQ